MKRRTPGLSRRGLIAGAAIAPLLGASAACSGRPTPTPAARPVAGAVDPAIELAHQCLSLHRENDRRHRRWGDVEAWLADNHNWFKLTEAQRRALPAARRLYDIDDKFAVLSKERPRAMRRLRRTPATSIAGAIGKLRVVAAAIDPEEFPSAYRLLEATIGGLCTLQRR